MASFLKSALLILAPVALSLFSAAQSHDLSSRTQTNRDIWVQPGERTGDLSCINCSIHVRGEVKGDVAAIHGNVTVEPQGEITGDVAAILGDIQVENNAAIRGDAAAMGGRIRRDPQGTIGGDQASLARFRIFLIALVPLIFLGLLIALVAWLVQRNRQPIPRAA